MKRKIQVLQLRQIRTNNAALVKFITPRAGMNRRRRRRRRKRKIQ
jgi:hypothetical protein